MIAFFNVSYQIKHQTILKNMTFSIQSQEKVLLCGPSGCGKSTIFNLMIKNIMPTAGKITFNKQNIDHFNSKQLNDYRHHQIKIIYQKDDLFDELSVLENLRLYYYDHEIEQMLAKAKLSHLKKRLVDSLSGGERQRINIVKACLSHCEILLCDEITSALDYENAKKMVDFILWMFQHQTVIFISHDASLFEGKINHLIQIQNHKIIKNEYLKPPIIVQQKSPILKEKSVFLFCLQQSLKKCSFLQLVIYYICIICLFITLYFNDIFLYFAKKSYTNYFNFDVVELINDKHYKNENSLNGYENIFLNSCVSINHIQRENIIFQPFYNTKQYTPIVINQQFLNHQNLTKIDVFSICGNGLDYESQKIDIITEKGMFVSACIYYDILFFNQNYKNPYPEKKYLLSFDFTHLPPEFSENPLYLSQYQEKLYVENNAYKDYLTFQLVFNSIKSIVNYFFAIIFIFSIIVILLLSFSRLLKDKKKIAIQISRGVSDFYILLTYFAPVCYYSILPLFLLKRLTTLLIPLLISLLLQIFFIMISYFILKKQNLHEMLKEETLY